MVTMYEKVLWLFLLLLGGGLGDQDSVPFQPPSESCCGYGMPVAFSQLCQGESNLCLPPHLVLVCQFFYLVSGCFGQISERVSVDTSSFRSKQLDKVLPCLNINAGKYFMLAEDLVS